MGICSPTSASSRPAAIFDPLYSVRHAINVLVCIDLDALASASLAILWPWSDAGNSAKHASSVADERSQKEWPPARRRRRQHSRENSQRATDVPSPTQGPVPLHSEPSSASESNRGTEPDGDNDAPEAAGPLHLVKDPASDGSEELARTALARFFNDHVDSEWWQIFQTSDNFRIAYIGTNTSNLAHLLGLRHFHRRLGCHQSQSTVTPRFQDAFQDGSGVDIWVPSSFEDAPQAPPHDDIPGARQSSERRPLLPQASGYLDENRMGQPTSSYQPPIHYPFPQIRPLKPWKPDAYMTSHLSQDPDQDLFLFPTQEVRQALVLAYFKHIHPLYPIMPIALFLRPDGELQEKPPLLLFQAVLLAGAHVCTHPLVAKNRLVVKSVLFRRANMLFHLRHETARLQLAQAAVLFTWHISDGDTVASGPWYWNGIAMRIACGLGLHRSNRHLPVVDRIINKRLWWSIFIAEAFSALETGRPCSIQLQDFDQDMLRDDDFVDEQDIRISGEDSETGPCRDQLLQHHVYMAELAIIILDVLEANCPASRHRPTIASINSRLAVWLLRSNCSSSAPSNDFYTNHLRIHYNLVIMHLNRNIGGQTAVAGRDVCSMASETILSSLDRIVKMGDIRRCHYSVLGAVTAAGIQLVQDLGAAVTSQSFVGALNLSERLTQLIAHGDSLAEYWPNAAAVTAVFRQLQHEYEQHISAGLNEAQPANIVIESPDWNSLFTSIHVPAYTSLADHEWLGNTNLTELSQNLSETVNGAGPSV